jgi:carbon-monoxide dehydrogenase small subunit
MEIQLKVNGRQLAVEVGPGERLVDVLRDRLGLTGTKKGCGSGDCGACTVLLSGRPVAACLTLAAAASGETILTVEGLECEGQLHPLQQAFIELAAVQCGFCTPGMLVAGKYLLDHNPHPTEADIRFAIAGNLCRCTGYTKIVEAFQQAAGKSGANHGD